MQSIAQGWLVYALTKSSFYLGIVAAAASLPVLLFALAGGALADRVTKRNLLIATQILSMVPAFALGMLTQFKVINIWEIIGLAFFLGTVNAFDVPGRQSFLGEMVQRAQLMNAVALNSAAFNGARIIGPLIAGLAIASIGVAACFYVNALSFLGAIIALLMIKARGEPDAGRSSGVGLYGRATVFFRDIHEGISFVRTEKNILRIMMLVATFSFFGIPFVTLLPVFAVDILKVGPKGLGVLAGSSGVGALSAALMLAFRADMKEKGRFMFAAGLVFNLSLLAFSLSKNYHLSMLTLCFVGWGVISFFAVANSFIQLSTPEALRGRVMSVYTLVFLGVAPLGNSVMGFLAEIIGADRAISIGSVLCLTIVMTISRRLKVMKEKA